MAPIVTSIEIDRPPQAVFAYATDPSTFAEWQAGVVRGCSDGDGSLGVGRTCTTSRRIGGAERVVTSEVTEFAPPARWAIRGVDGPIRAIVEVTVEPLADSTRSRVTVAVDFEGHGIGRLLVPVLVRRQARAEMPANCQRLKERIEAASRATHHL